MKDLISVVKDVLETLQQSDYPMFESYEKAVIKNIIENYRNKTKNESLELVINGHTSFEKIYEPITRKDNILSYLIPQGIRKKERKLLEENKDIIPIPKEGLKSQAIDAAHMTFLSPHLGNYSAVFAFSTAYMEFGNIPLDFAIKAGAVIISLYIAGSTLRHLDLEEPRKAKAELRGNLKLLDKAIRDVYPIIAKTADDPMDRFEESIITNYVNADSS